MARINQSEVIVCSADEPRRLHHTRELININSDELQFHTLHISYETRILQTA